MNEHCLNESSMPAAEVSLPGWRFDGRTSIKEAISLHIKPGESISMVRTNAAAQPVAAGTLRLDEPFENAPLLVHFADGCHGEFADAPQTYALLVDAGAKSISAEGMAATLARDWRLAVAALGFLIVTIAAFYVWLLPGVAAVGANMVPSSWNERIGQAAMQQLDASLFKPTTLSQSQRDEIFQRFMLLVKDDKVAYTLHFRHFSKGPNALALPGNHVILTDELVELVKGDLDAITGVLAHELGHIKHHHGLRMVIQASALTMLGSAVIGDYSSILATIPAAIGQLHYSREFETEADTYSHSLLCAKGMDPAKTAQFFDRVLQEQGDLAKLIPTYLNSHPDSVKRAQFFRSTC